MSLTNSTNSGQDHYSKSGMVIFLLSMVISIGFFIYIAFVHPGVSGIDKLQDPQKVEQDAGKQAGAKIEAEAMAGAGAEGEVESVDPESVKEPWVSTKGLIAAGGEAYAISCASCHGKTGEADGIAATPDTRNLVVGNWKAGGTSMALYKTLQNGLAGTGMVSFKSSISPAKRWAIVHWIRSITDNKVKDDDSEKIKAFAQKAD